MNGYGCRNRISGCRAAQGPERPGQAAVVRWKRCRVPRLSIQLQNRHEPRQFCFSRADGQMRSRAASDLPDSTESSGRSTHLKCCMQKYYALAFITRGSVRTLVRSVEETNGAEAWRLIHSRCAPDTQARRTHSRNTANTKCLCLTIHIATTLHLLLSVFLSRR